jgi:cephalosporin hydroxylase
MHTLFKQHNYASDKLSAHSYIPVYEELFKQRKNSALNVLEIGIGGGGSLQLWNDYFLNAEIYGIDPNYHIDRLDQFQRIHQIKDDAYSSECIQQNFIAKDIKFDIVIDDGPHNKQSQMLAMELYFPLLADDGIIVIEDVQDYLAPGEWIKDIIQSLPRAYQTFARVIDLRYLNKTRDDLMIVLDKSKIKDSIHNEQSA